LAKDGWKTCALHDTLTPVSVHFEPYLPVVRWVLCVLWA